MGLLSSGARHSRRYDPPEHQECVQIDIRRGEDSIDGEILSQDPTLEQATLAHARSDVVRLSFEILEILAIDAVLFERRELAA